MSGTQHPGQRGVSPVAGTSKPLVSRKVLALGISIAAAGIVTVALWKKSNPPEPPSQEKLPAVLADQTPYVAPVMVLPPIPVAATPAMPRFEPPRQPQPVQPDPQPIFAMPKADPVGHLVPTAAAAAPKPYMLTFAEPARGDTASGRPGGAPGAEGEAQPVSGVTYAASKLDGLQAGLLGDQTLLLMPQLIPCYLDTAVDSTFPGPIACHIPADIAPHGVTLLDRGSVVHGTYANNIQTGQARLFVAADWIEDKVSGCFVTLGASPIADSIGQTGAAGNVNSHNWERFSAAMILTGAQMAESLGQAALSKGGNTYLNFNSSGGLDSLANQILQKQIGIPPTITLQQGQRISVFLLKPLDFSKCYRLELRK